jgi:hypothetical protein
MVGVRIRLSEQNGLTDGTVGTNSQRIAGSLHIVQPVVLENSPFLDYDVDEAPQIYPDRRKDQEQWYRNQGFLLGPMLVMQPIENGSLDDFLTLAAVHNVERWPNRLLWRFFLCRTFFSSRKRLLMHAGAHLNVLAVARACIAMAYPRPLSGDQQGLEFIPPNNPPVSEFTHTDMHPGNGM